MLENERLFLSWICSVLLYFHTLCLCCWECSFPPSLPVRNLLSSPGLVTVQPLREAFSDCLFPDSVCQGSANYSPWAKFCWHKPRKPRKILHFWRVVKKRKPKRICAQRPYVARKLKILSGPFQTNLAHLCYYHTEDSLMKLRLGCH